MMTVFKAAQAISKEVELDKLLDTLLRVMVESAAAQHAILILQKGDELVVHLRASSSMEEVPLAGYEMLPHSLIISPHQETVAVTDATHDSLFGEILTSSRSRLAQPCASHGKTIKIAGLCTWRTISLWFVYLNRIDLCRCFLLKLSLPLRMLCCLRLCAPSILNLRIGFLQHCRIGFGKRVAEEASQAKQFLANMSHEIEPQ
jgi:hypothetical protein